MASGDGETEMLNLNGKCHSSLPSAAADPDRSLEDAEQVLIDAVELCGHGRGVGEQPTLGVGRAPDLVTRRLVERDDQRVGADRRDDDAVVLDERVLSVVPRRDLRAVVLDEVLAPELLAGRRVEDVQRRLGVDGEDVLAVGRGDGARDAVVGTDAPLLLEPPQLLALVEGHAADEELEGRLVVVVEVDLAVVDRRRRVPLPDRDLPQHLGAAVGPCSEETGLGGDTVAVRAAELRPVGREGRNARHEAQGQKCEADTSFDHGAPVNCAYRKRRGQEIKGPFWSDIPETPTVGEVDTQRPMDLALAASLGLTTAGLLALTGFAAFGLISLRERERRAAAVAFVLAAAVSLPLFGAAVLPLAFRVGALWALVAVVVVVLVGLLLPIGARPAGERSAGAPRGRARHHVRALAAETRKSGVRDLLLDAAGEPGVGRSHAVASRIALSRCAQGRPARLRGGPGVVRGVRRAA